MANREANGDHSPINVPIAATEVWFPPLERLRHRWRTPRRRALRGADVRAGRGPDGATRPSPDFNQRGQRSTSGTSSAGFASPCDPPRSRRDRGLRPIWRSSRKCHPDRRRGGRNGQHGGDIHRHGMPVPSKDPPTFVVEVIVQPHVPGLVQPRRQAVFRCPDRWTGRRPRRGGRYTGCGGRLRKGVGHPFLALRQPAAERIRERRPACAHRGVLRRTEGPPPRSRRVDRRRAAPGGKLHPRPGGPQHRREGHRRRRVRAGGLPGQHRRPDLLRGMVRALHRRVPLPPLHPGAVQGRPARAAGGQQRWRRGNDPRSEGQREGAVVPHLVGRPRRGGDQRPDRDRLGRDGVAPRSTSSTKRA